MPQAGAPERASSERRSELALFPLHTVLFPQSELPLRIFEPRYLDMVARCLRESLPFGVVSIQHGGEVGPASFHAVGTTACIVDWSQADGILQLRVRGERRFRVRGAAWRAADGLNCAHVDWLEPEPEVPLPCRYEHLARVVAAVLDRLGRRYVSADLEDSTWIGYRLAELLDLPLELRQAMLELEDALARLDQVGSALEK
jgi:Lon protease-like protein